jgi:hypothetical protein
VFKQACQLSIKLYLEFANGVNFIGNTGFYWFLAKFYWEFHIVPGALTIRRSASLMHRLYQKYIRKDKVNKQLEIK